MFDMFEKVKENQCGWSFIVERKLYKMSLEFQVDYRYFGRYLKGFFNLLLRLGV